MSKESQGSYRADPRMTGEAEDGERQDSSRIAIPIPSRPSLIPPDILVAYQQELEEQEALARVTSNESLIIDTEEPGLTAAEGADPTLARLALAKVPALSALPAEALDVLVAGARHGGLKAGEVLFHEGELAAHVHVLLAGELERTAGVTRPTRVLPGETLGLCDLLTGARRDATVRATGEARLLELDRQTVERALAVRVGLTDDVLSGLQAGMVHALVASPLLEGLTAQERSALAARFAVRELKEGQALVSPGEVVHLLAVVLAGRLTLEFRGKAGQAREIEMLEPGAYVLVASAFTGMPARMRLAADGACTLAVLGHRELAASIRELPSVGLLPRRAPLHARALCPDLWGGHLAQLG